MEELNENLEKMKIGEIIQTLLPTFLNEGLITKYEILKLQDKEYSKITFGVNYPILKKVNQEISLKENRYINGYPRYYARKILINEKEFILTQEWLDSNKENFINWFKKFL